MSLAVVALAAVPASGASARTIDGWDVEAAGDICSMASTFADDVTVALVWHPATRELGFMTTGPWSAKGKAKLTVTFAGDVPLKEWVDEAPQIVPGVGGRTAVIGGWGAEHSPDLGRAVVGAGRVSVAFGERTLGSYDLAGAPQAYRELMRCGDRLAPSLAAKP